MGLQREVTPQPDSKDGENVEDEVPVTVSGSAVSMTEAGNNSMSFLEFGSRFKLVKLL